MFDSNVNPAGLLLNLQQQARAHRFQAMVGQLWIVLTNTVSAAVPHIKPKTNQRSTFQARARTEILACYLTLETPESKQNSCKGVCTMLVLVFPKLFEFFKFICFLRSKPKDYTILNIVQVDEHEYELGVLATWRPWGDLPCVASVFGDEEEEHSKRTLKLRVLLVNDSDINFYSIFGKLVDSTSQTYYMLVGSCGSGVESDLGKLFFVNSAVKGDRGTLDHNQIFHWNREKLEERDHRLWDTEQHQLSNHSVTSSKICSTNFLNSNVIDEHFANGFLFDMETFDFYDICSKNGIKNFSCVRFVTDYVLSLGSVEKSVSFAIEF